MFLFSHWVFFFLCFSTLVVAIVIKKENGKHKLNIKYINNKQINKCRSKHRQETLALEYHAHWDHYLSRHQTTIWALHKLLVHLYYHKFFCFNIYQNLLHLFNKISIWFTSFGYSIRHWNIFIWCRAYNHITKVKQYRAWSVTRCVTTWGYQVL